MSMTLILWKAPVVREAAEAEALLEPFYDSQDDSAFEPSPDIAAVADELRRLYPWRDLSNEETVARMSEAERQAYSPEVLKEVRGVEGGKAWGDLPFGQTDRLLLLDLPWGGDNAVIDDIERLAREYELVLYDPQGPEVYLPTDPIEPPEAEERLGFSAYALAAGVTLLGMLLIAVGWLLAVPILNWLLIVAGLFILGVGCTLLFAFIFVPLQMRREARAKDGASPGA